VKINVINPPAELEAVLAGLVGQRIPERIVSRDHRVWKPDPTEIANRLGWLALPQTMRSEIPRIRAFSEHIVARGITDVVLLGMGGSSLAPETFARIFGSAPGLPRLHVVDTTHPDGVLSVADRLDPASVFFVAATKSGTTVETISLLRFFYRWLAAAHGRSDVWESFAAITDPGSPLADLARHHGFAEVFLNPPDIGGRFSALSLFGLVPAGLIGIDLERLLDSAAAAYDRLTEDDSPGVMLGAVLGCAARSGQDKATFVLPDTHSAFGDWAEQLIAESTGKQGTGIVPIVGEPLGDSTAYADDRLFIVFSEDGSSALPAELRALEADGHPIVQLTWSEAHEIGGQFLTWEFATAVAGHLLGIHPFDQPDVESAKRAARHRMTDFQVSGVPPALNAPGATRDGFWTFVEQATPSDYVALQVYAPMTEQLIDMLSALRVEIRRRTGCAVTVGFGPRFLHSTGQLHKGDRGNGRFVQLVASPVQDADVPDGIGSTDSLFSFATLLAAQALGDQDALRSAAREIEAFELGRDPAEAIGGLLEGG